MFSVNWLPVIVALAPKIRIAPPSPDIALLRSNIVFETLRVSSDVEIAPPAFAARLLTKILARTFNVLDPANVLTPPPEALVELSLTSTRSSVVVLNSARKPPPSAPTTIPSWIVRSRNVAVVEKTSKTRSIDSPSITVTPIPYPTMVTGFVMSRSPVALESSPVPASASLYVPAGTTMVFASTLPFAVLMASRSDVTPSTPLTTSLVVVTKIAVDPSSNAPISTLADIPPFRIRSAPRWSTSTSESV